MSNIGQFTYAEYAKWLWELAERREAARLSRRNTGVTDEQVYDRIKAARRKRARRNTARLESLVLK